MSLHCLTNTSVRAWRRYFPLTSVESVVELFEASLRTSSTDSGATNSLAFPEPNLAFLSIILGYIECHITTITDATETGSSIPPTTRKRALTTWQSNRLTKRFTFKVPSAPPSPEVPPVVEMGATKEEGEVSSSAAPSLAPSDSVPSPMSVPVATPTNPPEGTEPVKLTFPILRYEEAEQLYQRFYTMIVHDPKLASMVQFPTDPVSNPKQSRLSSDRRLVKVVCDVLCAHMSSVRQREHFAHAQSIYSLLKFGQLDSLGLAYATVAACQLLGYTDVHLALSEDHAWVEFGPPERRETADVSVMPALESSETVPFPTTSLCPPPVRLGHLLHSWLYLNGCPVVCNPLALSVAAAVAAIQPCGLTKSVRPVVADHQVSSLSSSSKRPRKRKSSTGTLSSSSDGLSSRSVETISPELVRLKQSLLWTVYRAGMLNRYPLGLTNLADIEEGFPSTGLRVEDLVSSDPLESPGAMDSMLPMFVEVHGVDDLGFRLESACTRDIDIPLKLLRQAVEIDRVFFRNQHVYPYIYLANYLRRLDDIPGALRYWAEAARVIGQYNHSSEDAEIYREFLDIATRVIPEIFRQCTLESRVGDRAHLNPLDSPLCLAYLLAFYDHLCLWEEGSAVPVLHVGWVDRLVGSLTRFSSAARTQLHIEATRSTGEENHPDALTEKTTRRQLRPFISGSGSVVTRSLANRDTTTLSQVDPLEMLDNSKEHSMEIMKKPEPLSVILPPPTSTVSLQSCSTTGSSVLSVFTNTPLPSIGDIESSTIASTTEASVVTARPLREILTNSEPPKQSLPPFESLFDGMDREEDLLDVYSLVVDCCEGSKEKVISRLARASQFRLLNPAFLMGDLSAPPFVTSEELNDFLMERPSSTIKEADQEVSEFFSEAPSSPTPTLEEVSDVQQTQESKKENLGSSEQDLIIESPSHSQDAAVDASSTESEVKMEIVELVHHDEEPTEDTEMSTVLQSQHRASSPESSACPSLPSIASTPPVFALPTTPPEVMTSTNVDNVTGVEEMDIANPADSGSSNAVTEIKDSRNERKTLTSTTPTAIAPEEAPVAEDTKPPGVYLHLYSTKMCRIAGLLNTPGCLKSSAIKLTLTAQSEVDFGRHSRRRRTLSSMNAPHPTPRWNPPSTSRVISSELSENPTPATE